MADSSRFLEHQSVVALTGDRRAARVPVADGVFVEVNRELMLLVDFSLVGVQLITTRRLILDQRVQLLLPGTAAWIGGRVVWASLESVGRSGSTQYRVGVEYEAPEQFEPLLKQFEIDLGLMG